MGRVIDLVDKETGEIIPSYISIDRKTNEITDVPASKVRIPERIGKTEITDKLVERNDGRKFVTTLQVNVEQRGVEFVPGTGKSPRTVQKQDNTELPELEPDMNDAEKQDAKQQKRNTWTNEDGSIRGITKWCGKPLTEQQQADYKAGKTIRLENVTDKQGQHAIMYVKFNPEKGRPYRYDENPDNAQKVAPSNESRTQVQQQEKPKKNKGMKV